MKSAYLFLTLFLLVLLTSASYARDVIFLNSDLDGDGLSELIHLSVDGAGDFQNFSVTVSGSTYKGTFFAVDGDLPNITVIKLDYAHSSRQLLVTTIGASWCDYHFLGLVKKRLIPLLVDNGSDCTYPPQPVGAGQIATYPWMGFWRKTEIYRLNSDKTHFLLLPKDKYDVNVRVDSAKTFDLEKATCSKVRIQNGLKVEIAEYVPKTKKYFLKAENGSCGWLREDRLDEYLSNLPYAG